MMKMKFLAKPMLLLGMLALGAGAAQAEGEIYFSHDKGQGAMQGYGSAKKEDYDVAIRLDDEGMTGMQIVSVSVPMSMKQSSDISNLRVWLSKELTLETVDGKKVNVPDIMTVTAATEFSQGWAEVSLPEPYTIPEGGLYVGYSFDMEELNEATSYPVVVTTETGVGSFFVHSSRKYRTWMDGSEVCSSCMTVKLSGARACSLKAEIVGEVDAAKGKPSKAKLLLTNYGHEGVKSFKYTYSVAGISETREVALGEDAIVGRYGLTKDFEVEIAPIGEAGVYTLTVDITEVNGVANECPQASASGTLNVFAAMAKHRAVMEEYTGLWCGYCPIGWAAMETLNQKYPDDFIGLAYHFGSDDSFDPMCVSTQYPSDVTAFPVAFMDRATPGMDPFFGRFVLSTDEMGIEREWLMRCEETAPADVTPVAELSADGRVVDMKATLWFPTKPAQGGYKVEFVLVADSLRSDKWEQANYYTGETAYLICDEMKQFVEGGSKIKGLYFNDVVVASSRLRGEDAVLPAEIEENGSYEVSYSFLLDDIKSVYGGAVLQDKRNLHVAALLIDANGHIVNANKAEVDSQAYEAGVEDVRVDASQGSVRFYDLSGRQLEAPQRGLNIIVDTNGKARKVVVN